MKMYNGLYKDIQYAIKNKADISELIKGYDISGLDLTGCYISKMDLTGQTLEGTNFSYATLGTDEGGIMLNNATVKDCCFQDARFPGTVMARRTKFIGCNFAACYVPYLDYCYASFERCIFCEAVFRIGFRQSLGVVFDDHFFGALTKYLGIKIIKNEEYDRLKKLEALYGKSTTWSKE